MLLELIKLITYNSTANPASIENSFFFLALSLSYGIHSRGLFDTSSKQTYIKYSFLHR